MEVRWNKGSIKTLIKKFNQLRWVEGKEKEDM